jgi:peptide deformylase
LKLPLHYYGSKILRMKTNPITEITPEIQQLASDMIETMVSIRAIGLAANQVGKLVSIFVSSVDPQGISQDSVNRVFINPKILWYSDEKQYEQEGCMSIPNTYIYIERPMRIKIEAMDINGKMFQLDLEGLGASNFCHENDHLNGVLHIDRVDAKQRRDIETKLRQIKKKYNP